ncbi:MAG: hypothetical protein R3208_01370 [Ketobacteraceae bacterium]|nr:hypothetical protein [Ketobacteraceae bacterium]
MHSATKFIRVIIGLNALTLIGFLVYALYAGDIDSSGPVLFGSPWGQMALVDLYAGFVLFALFIYSQEDTFHRAAGWILGLMVLGNLIACLYLLLWLNRKKSTDSPGDRLAAIKTNTTIK